MRTDEKPKTKITEITLSCRVDGVMILNETVSTVGICNSTAAVAVRAARVLADYNQDLREQSVLDKA